MMDFGSKFDDGLNYHDFLKQHANEQQLARWNAQYQKISLSAEQRTLLQSFQREMKVLVVTGAWCGDCVTQCPVFTHFTEANDKIRIHYFDQETHGDLAQALPTCGGSRVPVLAFLSEDNHFCGRYGDRTLAKYRSMVNELQGAACPSGIVLEGEMDPLLKEVIQEWLNEFERIQLMLRSSSRLRKLHGD